MLSATSIVLAFWLAVVLYFDIDGFREARRRPHAERVAGRARAATATLEP
jgi:predicted membrane protein